MCRYQSVDTLKKLRTTTVVETWLMFCVEKDKQSAGEEEVVSRQTK